MILLECLAGVGLVALLGWAVRTVARPAPAPGQAPPVREARTRLVCLVCGSPVVLLVSGPATVGLFEVPGFAGPACDGDVPHRCPGWAVVRWARTGRMIGPRRESETGREGST